MYKSYSYSDMPVPVKKRREVPKEAHREEVKKELEPSRKIAAAKDCQEKEKCGGLLDNIENDDIILIAIAIMLLMDDCDDKLLLAAIAFIFLSDRC